MKCTRSVGTYCLSSVCATIGNELFVVYGASTSTRHHHNRRHFSLFENWNEQMKRVKKHLCKSLSSWIIWWTICLRRCRHLAAGGRHTFTHTAGIRHIITSVHAEKWNCSDGHTMVCRCYNVSNIRLFVWRFFQSSAFHSLYHCHSLPELPLTSAFNVLRLIIVFNGGFHRATGQLNPNLLRPLPFLKKIWKNKKWNNNVNSTFIHR